ncbi:MAG: DMT family transporter [Clostridia bacterium]|nr:DMT family transporter [Clostridia bacterium]
MKQKTKEFFMAIVLLFVGLIWGFGFIAVQKGLDSGFSPVMVNLLRFAIATVLSIIFFPKDVFSIRFNNIKSGIAPAICLALGFFFQALGQKFTTPGNNALITGSYTILVPFFLALLFKIKPGKKAYFSAIITFAGILILSIPQLSVGQVRFGDFLSFFAATCFALHFITLEKALKVNSAQVMTFIQLAVATVMFLVMFLAFDTGNLKEINLKEGWLAIVYLGAFSSFLAYVIQTFAQDALPSTKVSILLASESLFGAILSIAFGYESLTAYFVVGGIMTMGGIVLSQTAGDNQSLTESESKMQQSVEE